MRISDWSSDVCSSDLGSSNHQKSGRDKRRSAGSQPGVRVVAPGVRAGGDPVPHAQWSLRPRQGICGLSEAPLDGGQIGRASCRGKSVSVRVDLGGRRIIKKKINNNGTTTEEKR